MTGVILFRAFFSHDGQHSQTVDALTSSPVLRLAFVRSSQSVRFFVISVIYYFFISYVIFDELPNV